jgi:uncharacterized protein (DUF952 family)/SAM-dependent methyltransferase
MMAIADSNQDQAQYWTDGTGPTWIRYQAHMDRQLAPFGDAALRVLAPQPGESVLDIGSGCGATTSLLADAVGPSGRVVGVDVSRSMSAVAADRLVAFAHATAIVSDAQVATVDEICGLVDLVYSRFGVMFFADPDVAFVNIRTLTKPGGRLVFVCWQEPSRNSWMGALGRAISHLVPPGPPSVPHAPGPFGFADGERTRSILEGAGWADVVLTPTVVSMQLFGTANLDEAHDVSVGLGRFPFDELSSEVGSEIRLTARQILERSSGLRRAQSFRQTSGSSPLPTPLTSLFTHDFSHHHGYPPNQCHEWRMIFHITTNTAWNDAQLLDEYTVFSLITEGFIHLSTAEQTLATAARFYGDVPNLVLLQVDETKCTHEIRWEAPAEAPESDARFPHLYGPLNLDAVLDSRPLVKDDAGNFTFPY